MSYQEQLGRVRRWLQGLEAASSHPDSYPNVTLPPEKREYYEDVMYAFFQNCWHLKDWILNDSDAPTTLKDAVKKVDRERAIDSLMLCADLANGSKHLRLERHVRRGAKVQSEIAVDVTNSTAEVTYTYKVVDGNGKFYEALELARQALSDWEKIISSNGGVI